MPKQRPRVFVGSSSEGLNIAKAIQLELDQSCEVEVWHQGVFGLSQGTLESLTLSLRRFDFAVFVLTADDLITMRGETKPSARDNVIFELGFFLGALGRERTFMVYDRTQPPDLPSDLDGVTAATFEPHRSGNLAAAVGAPCTKIQSQIENVGLRARYGFFKVGIESIPNAISSGMVEPTGCLLFTQSSEGNSAGKIIISYRHTITVRNIAVVGSGGLTNARLDPNSLPSHGRITIEVPAGGRYGDTIRLSGVRVKMADWSSPGADLDASISMEGNSISPNESIVRVVQGIFYGMLVPKSTLGLDTGTSDVLLDTSVSPAFCLGQLSIKEGFPGAFIGRDEMTPEMTNGTEFRLIVSGLVPGIDLQIEDTSVINVAERSPAQNGETTIRLVLIKTTSEVTILYRIQATSPLSLKAPLPLIGRISLAPICGWQSEIVSIPSYTALDFQVKLATVL